MAEVRQGQPVSLRIRSAGDAISPRWLERGVPMLAGPVDTPDKTTAEGLFDLPYGFASQKMSHVATRMGVQVCDQAGRVNVILPTPNGRVSNLAFGGPDNHTLFICFASGVPIAFSLGIAALVGALWIGRRSTRITSPRSWST